MSNAEMIESSPGWTGPDKSILDPFTIHEVTYKTIDTHSIQTAILLPKSLPTGRHPILINMHGGFLTMGHALFAPFFAPWIQQLILQNNAIALSIDYRLLPTARGVLDPLDDLDDFWTWFRAEFPRVLQELEPGQTPDFQRVLLTGGSAGGYCVLHTALNHPDEVSAVAMLYPLIDIKDEMFVRGPREGAPTVLRFPKETIMAEEEVVGWARAERESKEWKSRRGFELTPRNVAITQAGRIHDEVFNPTGCEDVRIFPLERIKRGAKAAKKIWVSTGDDDSTIRVESIRDAVAVMKEKLAGTEIRYDEAPGQDHGYDLLNPDWEQYAVGSLDWLKEAWLQG